MVVPSARIICIGNRLTPGDDGGPRVFDRLLEAPLPPGIEAVDGGLGGLDLVRFLERVECAVFVDSVTGFAPPGSVVEIPADEVAALAEAGYGHCAGLPALVRHLPHLLEGPPPAISIVGIEGPAGEDAIARATAYSLFLAGGGEP